jgi:hypothetical protein
MMKLTAAAAIGALILAASAAPALAGGYWDGGIVQGGQAADPPPAHWDRDCPCYCPRDRQDYGDWREERGDGGQYYGREGGWGDERVYDSGWQDQGPNEDYIPDAYSDNGYGVGPDGFIDEGNSGGVFVVGGGSAFSDANVDFDFRDRFRDHDRFRDRDLFRDHDRFRDHDFRDRDFHDRDIGRDHDRGVFDRDDHMHMTPQHGFQHMGAWGGASMPMHMTGAHMGGFSHPTMHGGAVMHGGGGRR